MNHRPTGAFKPRGGVGYFRSLGSRGVIRATGGNHGQSLAHAGARAGIPLTDLMPRGNSLEKNAAMRALGATPVERGEDFDAARAFAMEEAAACGFDLALFRDWVLA